MATPRIQNNVKRRRDRFVAGKRVDRGQARDVMAAGFHNGDCASTRKERAEVTKLDFPLPAGEDE